MNFYQINNKIVFSNENLKPLTKWDGFFSDNFQFIFAKNLGPHAKSKFLLQDDRQILNQNESIFILNKKDENQFPFIDILKDEINNKKVSVLNIDFQDWKENIAPCVSKKNYKINIVGLGDVGGMLVSGLKLIGKDLISEIGIFDLDEKKICRWEQECNQICLANEDSFPNVIALDESNLFDCDLFIFAVTRFIPKIQEHSIDVRLSQLETNSPLVEYYAKKASHCKFKGIFAVVSDPVDLLCKKALISSSLKPEQIRGFGLGVMNARANYFSKILNQKNFIPNGRVFGPHGKGLIVANDISNYDLDLSSKLTDLTLNANIAIRKLGFKPFVAPALSSACLSILDLLKQNWHYSSIFIDNAYFGVKNKETPYGLEIEQLNLNNHLFEKIKSTHKYLKTFNL